MRKVLPALFLGAIFCSCSSSRMTAGSGEQATGAEQQTISGNSVGQNASAPQLRSDKPAGLPKDGSMEVYREDVDSSEGGDRLQNTETK